MPYEIPQPEHKARYVRRKFGEIARRYDLFNDLITQGQHRYWKNVLVGRLELQGGERVLDLCCGTGDIALRCARRLGPRGRVVAADFSEQMLHVARTRLPVRPAGQGGPPLALLCGDAMHLPFPDASFDAIAIGYGLRNVTHLEGCLAELRRVLKPGGVLASLDVGKVRSRIVAALNHVYFFYVVPWIGRRLQPGQEMFTYLPESSRAYPHQDRLKELLRVQGFVRTELIEFLLGASVIHVARKPAG
ncbi:MAG: ubiquinone/menaquinone biosynthesis methyltransferase [Candidatus Lambdaproteobacteria bacterium]|nr:ubiquinone/menaquinone biosynthesis methyltransferase [Candidatus Lambdaproteobacteria bacterium]